MPNRVREEVLNVVLAQSLIARAITANPETIARLGSGQRAMPDVIVTLNGIRCGLEGKLDDVVDAKEIVTRQAKSRIDTGIVQLAIAVVYPASLREIDIQTASTEIASTMLAFRIMSDLEDGTWLDGDIELLVSDIRRAYGVLVSDDIVSRAVEKLSEGMHPLVRTITRNAASGERLAALMGVYEPETEDAD